MTLSSDATTPLEGVVTTLPLSALARLVHHELRTPLAVVVGHLELLSDRAGELPAELRWSVHALERAVHRLDGAVAMTCDLVESHDRRHH